MTLKGIDISYPSQPDPLPMAKVKAEGIAFVVQKVSQGVYFRYDPEARARIREVRKAGLIAGAYHFLTRVEDAAGASVPWNSGTAQCNAFVAALPQGDPEGLICMVNWENNDGQRFTFDGVEHEPDRRGGSWRELRDFVRRWFAVFPTHPLFLYTRESYAVPRSEGHDVGALNPRLYLWDANWVNGGTPALGRDIDDAAIEALEAEVGDAGRPAWTHRYIGFSRPTIWQFGGMGISGYDGGQKVDGDLFKGRLRRLEAFTRSGAGLEVRPVEVGVVESMVDERLAAALVVPPTAPPVTAYEIQLAARPAQGRPDWQHRIWAARGTPTEAEAIDDDDQPITSPAPAETRPPHFETVDGCPAVNGMTVGARRPGFRLSTDEPIDMYRWRLRQDDEVVEREDDATSGITDGTCVEFAPTFALRRGRPSIAVDAADGALELPFTPGVTYDSRTYPRHSNFAVDFNRKDRQDAGEWVHAPAKGKVQFVIKGSASDPVSGPPSEVYIGHRGGIQTVYAHMDHIQVRRGDAVKAGQKLGRVSNVGAPGGPHLHLQIRRRRPGTGVMAGKPIKMRLRGKLMKASVGDSDFRPETWGTHFGQDITGIPHLTQEVRPEIRVAVRRASDGVWSRYRRLDFVVEKTSTRTTCVDPGCDSDGDGRGASIEHIYDGPELAPGTYSVRYRVVNDLGDESPWVVDDSIVVTGP